MSVPGGVVVDEVVDVTDEVVEAFAALIPQLSSSAPPVTRDELDEIVGSPASVLLVARDRSDGAEPPGRIVGSLTLVLFRVPTGARAWIEDVVVDAAARGAGVGEALVAAAVERSRLFGAKTVDLTSRPSREAAHRLYRRTGFVERETTVYRFSP